MNELERLESYGVAWCTEADFARLLAAAKAADDHCLCMGLRTVTMLDGSRQPCPIHEALAPLLREVEE